jgi:hypothetical protein
LANWDVFISSQKNIMGIQYGTHHSLHGFLISESSHTTSRFVEHLGHRLRREHFFPWELNCHYSLHYITQKLPGLPFSIYYYVLEICVICVVLHISIKDRITWCLIMFLWTHMFFDYFIINKRGKYDSVQNILQMSIWE